MTTTLPGRVTVTSYHRKCDIQITSDTTGLEIIGDVCDIFKLPEVKSRNRPNQEILCSDFLVTSRQSRELNNEL